MNRIKYTCKNCNWTGSVVAEWGDIKPKKCPGYKCNTSFRKNPEHLSIELPKNESPRTTRDGQKTEESSKRTSDKRSSSREEKTEQK